MDKKIKEEIEQVKNPRKKTADDKWFRKMWYISQARNRRKQLNEKPFVVRTDNGDSFFRANRQ